LLAVLQLNKVAETRNQTSEGVLKYVQEIITAALQAMPILMQHPDYGQHPVLQHPVFKSRAFLAVAQRQFHAYRTQTSMFAQLERPIVGPVRTAATAYGSVSTPLYAQEQLQDTLAKAALSYAAGVSDSCNMQLPDGTWWMVVTTAERDQLLKARSMAAGSMGQGQQEDSQRAGAPRATATPAGEDTTARSETTAAPAAAAAAAAAAEVEATANGSSAGGGIQNTAAGAPVPADASAGLQQPAAAAEQQRQPAVAASQQQEQEDYTQQQQGRQPASGAGQQQSHVEAQQQQQGPQGRQPAAGTVHQQSQVDAQEQQRQGQGQEGRQPAASGAGQQQSRVDAQQQQQQQQGQPRAGANQQQQQQQQSAAAGPVDGFDGTGDAAAGRSGDSNGDMMATMVRMSCFDFI
jgi:hypothetical protein